jgi:hypothetical protein
MGGQLDRFPSEPGRHPLTLNIEDLKDAAECKQAADLLYELLEKYHGEKEARRIFDRRPLTPRQLAIRKNIELVEAYSAMPNKTRLAKHVAKLNNTKRAAALQQIKTHLLQCDLLSN